MSLSTQAYAQTLARLLSDTVGHLPTVTRPVHHSVGWRLASDVVTRLPSPSFDNSQMDGYGIGYANVAGGRFRVGPDVPAGTDPAEVYHYGVNGYGHDTAVPIMTGAKIPEDVVAIVPVERADPPRFVDTGDYVILPPVEVGTFIRKTGSDMRAGTLLASEGDLIDAPLVAAAASQGLTELPVKARPRIALIAGGDEVVTGGSSAPAKIFDANTPMLQALGTTHGVDIVATAATTDDLRDFRRVLDALVVEHAPDVIITSGGISEGKYEVVRQLLERIDAWVGNVQQQPGGPQGYGIYKNTPLIALPGNPISSLVSARMLVLPALWQAFGSGYQPVEITARLNMPTTGIRGKTQYRRGVVGLHGTEVVAQLQGDAGSHLVAQAVGTNALIEVPPMIGLKPGQLVTAHLFADTTLDAPVAPVPKSVSPQSQWPQQAGRTSSDKTGMVLIASTRAAAGIYEDDAGPKLVDWLTSKGYATPEALVVADHDLEATMESIMAGEHGPMPDVLITSGGTGISPTDQTVDVISQYLDQQLPNVMTAVLLQGLKNTPHAALSRGVAGLIDQTFVATLPGSMGGVSDGIAVLDQIIDHIVEQIRGGDHPR